MLLALVPALTAREPVRVYTVKTANMAGVGAIPSKLGAIPPHFSANCKTVC